MKYIERVGDNEVIYEGTPEEIATYIYYEENGIDIEGKHIGKKELIYDQEDAIDFIWNKLFIGDPQRKRDIRSILGAEEDYMRSVGIIE